MSRPTPPRLTEALLSRLLRVSDRREVLGDLREEFATRASAAGGPAAARRWYRREALAICARVAGDRLRNRDDRPVVLPPVAHTKRGTLTMQDLRFTLRSLRRHPTFALMAVLTLGLGIGASTTIFSTVHGVFLRPLPYPAPDRIVTLWEAMPGSSRNAVAYANFLDWRDQSRSFAAMSLHGVPHRASTTLVRGGVEPALAVVMPVTRGFFDVMGIRPDIGRPFVDAEMTPGGPPAAVVSHRFWQATLGGAGTPGPRLQVFGVDAEVVGVMPSGFDYPGGADVWIPGELFTASASLSRTAHNFAVTARLRPDATLEDAQVEMTTIARRLKDTFGDDIDAEDVSVIGLREDLVGSSREAVLLLVGAVGLLLAVACANVANGLLARGRDRAGELAIRLALGANRRRLVGLLAVESLMLSFGGGVLGLLLAFWATRAMAASGSTLLPRLDEVSVDGGALLFAVAASIATALAFGLLPALASTRASLGSELTSARSTTASRGRLRARRAVVALEVAMAVVLVVAAGLLMRSLDRVLSVDVGFDPAGVLAVRTVLPIDRYADAADRVRFYDRFLAEVRVLPGVEAAGLTAAPPFGVFDPNGGFLLEGQTLSQVEPGTFERQSASYRVVGDGYFEAMGYRLQRGRVFDRDDGSGAPIAAVVNDVFVRQHFADGDPIGRRIRFAGMDAPPENEQWLTIVGVVAATRRGRLEAAPRPAVYVTYRQRPVRTAGSITTAVKVRTDAAGIVAAARERLTALDADVPMEVSTMAAGLEGAVSNRRLSTLLLAAFGIVALVLAASGIYGVLAMAVAQQTRELGVRMALGADAADVVRQVLAGALGPVAIGLLVGLGGAAWATRLMRAQLFDVEPGDPATLAVVVLVVLLAGLAAGIVPARRASRVMPVEAMRAE